MKLKEYLDYLNKIVKEEPRALDFEVIYSSDDEGNSFDNVVMRPTLCQIEEMRNKYDDVHLVGTITEVSYDDLNAVIIN